MESQILNAQSVLAKAVSEGKTVVSGSADRLANYFAQGAAGNCGFIVEGEAERFLSYLVTAAGGGCAVGLTADAAAGKCGFVIKGDYNLAWSNKYFDGAKDGRCGFIVESSNPL